MLQLDHIKSVFCHGVFVKNRWNAFYRQLAVESAGCAHRNKGVILAPGRGSRVSFLLLIDSDQQRYAQDAADQADAVDQADAFPNYLMIFFMSCFLMDVSDANGDYVNRLN